MDPLCQEAIGSLAEPELIKKTQRWQLPLQPCYAKRSCGLARGGNDGREKSRTRVRSSSIHTTRKTFLSCYRPRRLICQPEEYARALLPLFCTTDRFSLQLLPRAPSTATATAFSSEMPRDVPLSLCLSRRAGVTVPPT